MLAWGAGAQGTAVAADGGYRVNGTWKFASGAKHATWLGGHCMVHEADGSPRLDANGVHANRTALFPRDQAAIADDWYVMGLRGTRSEGYAVEDLFVESRLTLDRETPAECRIDSTLYIFPTTNAYASVFSGVALGIARAMLDDLVALTRKKSQRGARTSMRESAVIHTRLAELEARLGAARAYQRETIRDVWPRWRLHASSRRAARRIRLATTYASTGDRPSRAGLPPRERHAIFSRPGGSNADSATRTRSLSKVQGRHTNFETVRRHCSTSTSRRSSCDGGFFLRARRRRAAESEKPTGQRGWLAETASAEEA